MSLKFVSLHNHDTFSLYDGLATTEDYCEWILKNAGEDSAAFATTNHGNISSAGYMAAAQKKYKNKVKIIWGIEAYYLPSLQEWSLLKNQHDEDKKQTKKKITQEDDSETSLVIENEKESKAKYFSNPLNRRNHLVLVAYNQQGLKNLFKLTSRSYREGFYRKPRIDLKMLRELNEGLIASSACIAGIPAFASLQIPENVPNRTQKVFEAYDQELGPLMEIFGPERFYLELQFNKLIEQKITNLDMIEYSKKSGYKLICTADAHYSSPELFRDRELYRLLGYQMQGQEIDKSILEKTRDDLEAELYLKNGDQIYDAYKKTFSQYFRDDKLIIDAIERTYGIAHDFIGNVTPEDKIKLPRTFQITEKVKTPFDRLKLLCIEGLKQKKLDQKQQYIDRAIYELKVIKNLGVEEYFLALKEMLDAIRTTMLTGVGRGSGAGSLVCYLLNITFLDPVKNGLLFERFLSPSRKEMPDIDSDVENKEQAFDILKAHFGSENVLAISNWNRLQLKSLIKDISKLYEVPFEEVNKCTKLIEKEARKPIMAEIGNDQKLYELTYDKALKYSPTLQDFIKQYPKVGEHIENLYQAVRAASKHAGGVLVVPNAEECVPIIRIRDTDQSPITEGITAQHSKYFGLVKYDMLGLATLRTIRKCIEIILKKNGNSNPTITDVWQFYDKHLHPDVINDTDEKIFKKVYCDGRFPSIFQFAETGVQNFCTQAKPKNVNDISNITALWRPGALCLSENTTVTTSVYKNNGRRRYKTIKDLYDQFHSMDISKREKQFPIHILSLNEQTHTLTKNKIKNVIKSGKKEVFKIFFQREKRYDVEEIVDSSSFLYQSFTHCIEASEDHRFLTKEGWKSLKELRIGDYLCMNRISVFKTDDPKKHTRKAGIKGEKAFRRIAFFNYEYRCIFCNWNEGTLDVNHVEGNRKVNNSADNLCFMCPNHHRVYTEGGFSKELVKTQKEQFRLINNDNIRYVRFVGIESCGQKETYDISMEEPHNNFVAGCFVVHNSDNGDKKYLKFKEPDLEKEHTIIKDILGKSRLVMIFQEQFMMLAHKLAGFSLEESDQLRKILVKPSHELGEELKKKRIEYREKFIKGCVETGLTEKRATKLWDEEILGFISYGFNRSHSQVYAYNSYQCAYLYTYYEEEWLKACLETDPDLEKTINVIRGLGYHIAKVDVNHSPVNEWFFDGANWHPPLTSLKGIGESAAQELVRIRDKNQFCNIDNFFFNSDNHWRWSKLNKKSIETLIKAEAFGSLDCVGDRKDFKNYKHMYEFLSANWDLIKKNKVKLSEAVLCECEDWTTAEKISFQKDILGFYDKGLIVGKFLKVLREFEICAIDEDDADEEMSGDKNKVWALVEKVEEKTTKTGKPYLTVVVSGQSNKTYSFKIWNMSNHQNTLWHPGNVNVFSLDYSDQFGYSLSRKTKPLKLQSKEN